jgi:hypothetical protein
MMLLYAFVGDEAADPRARRGAAEVLVDAGLLRRERSGPSLMFMWLAAMTAVVVTAGAASTLGPAGAVVFATGAVVLGAYVLRRRRRREGESELVYLGAHGERLRLVREPDARR